MLGVIEPFAGRAEPMRAPADAINKLCGSALVDQLGEGERLPVGKRMQPCDSVLLTFCGCGVP